MNYKSKTLYEERMKRANDKDKILFYDYLCYKRTVGWRSGLVGFDWNRPSKINKAKYCSSFLNNLPNYYFLGFPIKELLKSSYSKGLCHACSVALSLCFDDFEIVTCNLANYVDYCNHKYGNYLDEFEHSFIVVNLDGVKTVIDTTWGIITDYEVYKYIFNINNVRIISSNELKNTDVYKLISDKKHYVGPSFLNILHKDNFYDDYALMFEEYLNLCKNYTNSDNAHLQDFINRCLYSTSCESCFNKLRYSESYEDKVQYPNHDLYSIDDDETDFILDSPFEKTRKNNDIVLKNYHNGFSLKKILKKHSK